MPSMTQTTSPAANPDQKMIALCQALSALAGDRPAIFQFLSVREDEGVSPLIRRLASVAATELGRRVLLIDANRPPRHASALKAQITTDLESAAADSIPVTDCVFSTRVAGLDLALLSAAESAPHTLAGTPKFAEMLAAFARVYDLTLIDAPPTAISPDAPAMAPQVTGTILVVEAGSTRWQAVDSLRKRIEKYGGTVSGVILNKRRIYIPDFIYRRL